MLTALVTLLRLGKTGTILHSEAATWNLLAAAIPIDSELREPSRVGRIGMRIKIEGREIRALNQPEKDPTPLVGTHLELTKLGDPF